MKRTGSVLSFVIGLGLLAAAGSSAIDRMNDAPGRITAEFAAIHTGGFDRMMQDGEDEKNTQAIEGLAGAAFMIAGFALWSSKKEPATVVAA